MADTQERRIHSTFAVRAAAGESVAVVRVRNLQGAVQGPQDAWGRQDKAQPVLVSVELSFAGAFDTAASADKLGGDTVHYGNLSKAILSCLEDCRVPKSPTQEAVHRAATLRDVLDRVWAGLTGLRVNGLSAEAQPGRPPAEPFLNLSRLRYVAVTVCLPKASLLGEGISLTASSFFEVREERPQVRMFGVALRLHRLRVPVLVGVNSNERLRKQFVVADVEIDKFDYRSDVYAELEGLVVAVWISLLRDVCLSDRLMTPVDLGGVVI
jgi:dihydroneopterin aldolase